MCDLRDKPFEAIKEEKEETSLMRELNKNLIIK